MTDWQALRADLADRFGLRLSESPPVPVGGGCINAAWRVSTDERDFFLKLNDPNHVDMFAAEADALAALDVANALRVPTPVGYGRCDAGAYLLLEWIDLGTATGDSQARLGDGLARLHDAADTQFGWHRDNTIGSTPQRNDRHEAWASFLRDCRLAPQFNLAAHNGFGSSLARPAEALLDAIPTLLCGAPIAPSLLHGDLWGGNWGVDEHGAPVVFDPASFYGDPEADIAMTELFGGFGGAFVAAYRARRPEHPTAPVRRALYRLYHLLNHLNLFGRGYLAQVEQTLTNILTAPA